MKRQQILNVFRALRHPNFRAFFAAQALSTVGTWMQMTAGGWLIWRMTHSEAALGFVQFVGRLPTLFLTLPASILVDRHSRHRLVILSQTLLLVQAAALAALTISPFLNVPVVTVLAFALGLISCLDVPARQAFVIEMVGKEDLPNAIALNSFVFNLSRIIGPSIAGLAVGFFMARNYFPSLPYFPEASIFILNAASYAVIIVALVRMKLPARAAAPLRGGLAAPLMEAAAFVWSRPEAFYALFLTGLVAMFGYSHSTILPAVVGRELKGGAEGFGILLAATGVGAMLGALYLAHGSAAAQSGRAIPASAILLGLALFCFSFSRWMWLSSLFLVPTGIGMMISSAGTNTFLQKVVPDELRGRMMGLYSTMFLGFIPLGSLLLGALGEWLGPLMAIRMGGIVCAAGGIILIGKFQKRI